MDLSPQQQRLLLDLARTEIRRCLARYISAPESAADPADPGGPSDDPADGMSADPLDPSRRFLDEPAGCFVSLHECFTHRLRGCVGQVQAVEPLGEGVRAAAWGVLRDPRFERNPVSADELPSLEIEITVLSPLRPVRSPLDFEPLRDGLWLTVGTRCGCFLPQVGRETGWTREQLLERLCTEKLNLPGSAWQWPDAKLDVFTAMICGPEPFERDQQT